MHMCSEVSLLMLWDSCSYYQSLTYLWGFPISMHLYYHSFFFYIKNLQVAIEVEREEDEGGLVGETFTDYVSVLFILSYILLF